MAFGRNNNYNNNGGSRDPVVSTFGPSFANAKSRYPTKLCIGYFNSVMKISIGVKTSDNNGFNNYPTFDTQNATTVYLTFNRACLFLDLVDRLFLTKEKYNVAILCKDKVLKISDGKEYGLNNPCIVIITDSGNGPAETIYECNTDYEGYANIDRNNVGQYEPVNMGNVELNMILTCIREYVKAFTNAYAGASADANRYHSNFIDNIMKGIADKVGVSNVNNASSQYFNASQNNFNNNKDGNFQADNLTSIDDALKEYESNFGGEVML